MSWRLEGTYFQTCNCEVVCPCATSGFTAPADYETCGAVLVFHVVQGDIGGAAISEAGVVMVTDGPRVLARGDWSVGLLVDVGVGATPAAALIDIFLGRSGGPMSRVAPLIGATLGAERACISYVDEERSHRVEVDDRITMEMEDFVAPQDPRGPVYRLTGAYHPASNALTVGRATRSRGTAFGLAWNHDGKSGLSARFGWAGP